MSNLYISDMDKCIAGRVCSQCPAPATDCIEWEWSEGGRFWERFCLPCFEAALAAHKAEAETPEWKAQAEADRLANEAELAYYRQREEEGWKEYRAELLAEFAQAVHAAEAREPIPAYWAGLETAGEF